LFAPHCLFLFLFYAKPLISFIALRRTVYFFCLRRTAYFFFLFCAAPFTFFCLRRNDYYVSICAAPIRFSGVITVRH
jgi:hypothetical protein